MSPNPSMDDEPKNKEPSQSPSPPYKFRGRGRSKEGPTKPAPWGSHAHDEYAEPKKRRSYDTNNDNNKTIKQRSSTQTRKSSTKSSSEKVRRVRSPKGNRRPTRIRFEDNVANAASYGSDDEELEEKSNRPLNSDNASVMSNIPRHKPKKRPKKKPSKPTYVNAANIHAQEFRSAYRARPLPPTPQRRTNAQRGENGKEQFNNMIKQAAAMEGV